MTTRISEELRRLADNAENADLDTAVRALAALVIPFPDLADAPCGVCGWQEREHGPKHGESLATDHEFSAGPAEGTPLFSEAFLYDLFGKEEARTILTRVHAVLRAAGVSEGTIRDLF